MTGNVLDVLRRAQRALHEGGHEDLVRDLDEVRNALAILPDLHVQMQRRLAVLFPDEVSAP